MILSGQAHTVVPGAGRVAELGIAKMRVLAAGEATARAFTLAEFTGGAGPWSVPHLHQEMEESFFVLDGGFTFTVGEDELDAEPGTYVLVPRGTRHLITARKAASRCLVLMVPGGLEDMFYELSELGSDALRDPAVRAAISARHDSLPV